MPYTVLVSRRAQKDLRKLPRPILDRIAGRLRQLGDDPYPEGRKKLKGQRGDYWRIRVGEYRVIYEVDQGRLTVLVLRALDRKEAY